MLLLCVFFVTLKCVLGSNILFLSAVVSPSHHIFNRALVLGLADKGHNLTFLSADIVEKKTPNVHYIHLEKMYETFYGKEDSFKALDFADASPYRMLVELAQMYEIICDGALSSNGLESLLNYPVDFKFDAVLHDFVFGPCMLPLLHRFDYPPMIAVSGFGNPPYSTDYIGGQKYPAYIPHYADDYSTEMTFSQRVFNTFLYAVEWM